MTTKKKIWIGAVLLAVLVLAAALMHRPLYNLYRDVSFYWEERSETEKKVKIYAESMGISYGEYPESLIDLYERNPETEAFVLNYPFREKADIDLSGYALDEVPLFLQWDPMWGYEKYGSDVIGITGCGPTCLAMAGWYLTQDDAMNPAHIARFAQQGGYYEKGYGSSWTLISEGSAKLGLHAKELPLVKKKLVTALEAGHPVILAVGKGDFTATGHYIVLTGLEDGKFRLNDPNSRLNSAKLWRYEDLEGQIRNIWEIALPG